MPFVRHHGRYESWFERHRAAYVSELLAVRALLPWSGRGVEIGVGTGRFAGPLGVQFGIDPAVEMLAYACARGIRGACAVAEALPFPDATFDHALVVTTICFVEDVAAMLGEAHRVLKMRGQLVIGFIDRDSGLGQYYLSRQAQSVFYREARFHSAGEVERSLSAAGFAGPVWVQTLAGPPDETREIEASWAGRGEGAFVVVRARRNP